MVVSKIKILELLNGTKQFIVPVYQRTYNWEHKHCKRLWEDVLTVAKNPNMANHFLGSVVEVANKLHTSSDIKQLHIIDGQQRLTTFSMLLCAYGREIETRGDILSPNLEQIENRYLLNHDEDAELHHKLILSDIDDETFKRLIKNLPQLPDYSERIIDNYEFFKTQLANLENLEIFFAGIRKLEIVCIALDRNTDNPQLIFESLNSTGLDLSQSDLIRNYIMMSLDISEQAQLYNQYWSPIQKSFIQYRKTDTFDRFLRDYLTMKLDGKIPELNEIYDKFKLYVATSNLEIKDIVIDIYRHSTYYAEMVSSEIIDHHYSDLKPAINEINRLEFNVSYPFILELFHDYKELEILQKEEFIEVLKLLVSYIFRRKICDIPTNSHNTTFARLSTEINKENYLHSFQQTLLNKKTYRRFPQCDEFKKHFQEKNVYLGFSHSHYLMEKLENYEGKELVAVEDYQVEHIIPQNEELSDAWKIDLWRRLEGYSNTVFTYSWQLNLNSLQCRTK
tara:strand:+ start:1917 stop:3437 length:1521 start_codon:yes stop_codon:yes gene_type:complete